MKLNVTNLGKVSITVDENYWDANKAYDRLVIVQHRTEGICYISRQRVPISKNDITNRAYWIPLGKGTTTVSFGNFTLLRNTSQLPDTLSSDAPYLIEGVAYFWVGTGGDTKEGKYQSVDIRGEQGASGLSAYQLWIKNGGDVTVTEEEWLESYVKGKDGKNGDPGIQGPQGERGPEGPQGPQGVAGKDGADGKDGTNGINGTNGKDGKDGKDGANGINGAPGKDGKDGQTPYIYNGNWWIGGVDTGVPATGSGGGGGNTDIRIIENPKTIRIGLPSGVHTAILNSPPENTQTITFKRPNTYGTFLVNGSNLTGNVILSMADDTIFNLQVGDDAPASIVTLTADQINNGDGVIVKCKLINSNAVSALSNTAGGTIHVTSTNHDFTFRRVKVIYDGKPSMSPTGTDVTPGGGFNPGVVS